MNKENQSRNFLHLGFKSRFKKIPSQALVDSAFDYELKLKHFLHEGLGMADMAHVAMLMRTKIIKPDVGKALLKELLTLQKQTLSKLKFSPRHGDLYNNRDLYLSKKTGNLSGVLHTGRPRREATNIAFLIACRERVALLGKKLSNLCNTLLGIIESHKHTYMTDFTYLHHAQPTTLAHYLLGYLYSLLRDLERFKTVYARLNKSPAGSGSVNGSQLPIDREYLMRLLGFDSIIEHTRDAMWQPDVPIETISAVITLITNLDRMAEELQIWTTLEFDFFEPSDAHSRTSIIMPQKKNPYALAFIRGTARNMLGKLVSIAAAGQTPSGQPDNRLFIYEELPVSLDITLKVVVLFNDILKKGKFKKKMLFHSTQTGFPNATDLVDFLTINCSLDNRSAHRIVGLVARRLNKQRYTEVTPQMIYKASKELGISLKKFKEADFLKLFDIKNLIELRQTRGGAGTGPVNAMIRDCRKLLGSLNSFFIRINHTKFKSLFYKKIKRIFTRYQ